LLIVVPILRRRLMPRREPFPQPLEDVELDGDAAALDRLVAFAGRRP
jgi:hypothetical protein